MASETTDRLAVVDVQLPSPRLTSSSNGIPAGEPGFTVPGRAKLLPGGLPVQEMQPNLLHIGVEARIAEQVKDGELIALPDRYGKPVETLKVIERMPWTRDTNSPHSHLVRLITKPAQDKRTLADDMEERNRKAREYHERERKGAEERLAAAWHRQQLELVAVLEEMGIEAAAAALEPDQRAALLDEFKRKRDAAVDDQPAAAADY